MTQAANDVVLGSRSIVGRGLSWQRVVARELSLVRSRLVSGSLHGCPLARASLHRQPFRLLCGSAALLPLARAAMCKLRTGGALDVLRAARASLSPAERQRLPPR